MPKLCVRVNKIQSTFRAVRGQFHPFAAWRLLTLRQPLSIKHLHSRKPLGICRTQGGSSFSPFGRIQYQSGNYRTIAPKPEGNNVWLDNKLILFGIGRVPESSVLKY